jgi:hypothetical protein
MFISTILTPKEEIDLPEAKDIRRSERSWRESAGFCFQPQIEPHVSQNGDVLTFEPSGEKFLEL